MTLVWSFAISKIDYLAFNSYIPVFKDYLKSLIARVFVHFLVFH